MWVSKNALIKAVKEAVYGKVKEGETITSLKKDLEELKLKKVMEEREIKHLVKLKEEKLEIDHQKKEVELDGEYQKKVMALQENYHEKVLKNIEVARTEMKDVYTKIMDRLPNVNMEIKRGK